MKGGVFNNVYYNKKYKGVLRGKRESTTFEVFIIELCVQHILSLYK